MVEDLTVLNDADRTICGEHRLIAVLEVDDRQPARSQPHTVVDVAAVAIGSAVDQGGVHPLEQRTVYRVATLEVVDAADPAHRRGLGTRLDGCERSQGQGRRLSTERRFAGRITTSHTVVAMTER